MELVSALLSTHLFLYNNVQALHTYEIDWKTVTAKHFEGRKAVSSPGFKAFKVLYYFLLSVSMWRLYSSLTKKKECSETPQVVWGLRTLGHLTLDTLLKGWKVASSQSYANYWFTDLNKYTSRCPWAYVQTNYLSLSECRVKMFVSGFWSDAQDISQAVSYLCIIAVMMQSGKWDKPDRT